MKVLMQGDQKRNSRANRNTQKAQPVFRDEKFAGNHFLLGIRTGLRQSQQLSAICFSFQRRR